MVAYVPGGAHVVERAMEEFPRDSHHLLELLFVGGIDGPLERVQPRFHALLHRLRERHRGVRGEKHVGHRQLALEVRDAVHQQPRVHERLAEVEHADLLHARLAHLARDALEQVEVHVPLGLHLARAQGAEAAAVVAARRDLDLDTLGRR
jgi:hypothetical protein